MTKKDASSSIESQRMIIESFCKFGKLDLVEEYVDDGYSGGNFYRPSFKRMLDDIESGKINCVITKGLSRLGRELYGTVSFIEEYFLPKKCVYGVTLPFFSYGGSSLLISLISVGIILSISRKY